MSQAAPGSKQETLARPGFFKRYLRDSRGLLGSLILVIPLFCVYQIGVLSTNGIQNGVDFVTRALLWDIFGGNKLYYVLFNFGVLAMLGAGVAYLRKYQKFSARTFLLVIAESTLYGLIIGGLVSTVLVKMGISPHLQANSGNALAELGAVDNFVLSIGAGLYEELVFRLMMLGGSVSAIFSFLRARKALEARENGTWTSGKNMGFVDTMKMALFSAPGDPGAPPALDKPTKIGVLVVAILVTSFIFSGIHYVGSLADDFTIYSFMFRFLMGIIFAALYYLRGFAVAVYTHAIYDVFVLVF